MKSVPQARILVVDDEENIRKSLKMILEYEGYTFLEASSGEEALDLAAETVGLDLILLDIKLPGKDGLEVLAELKKRPYSPEVIMISGQGTIKTAIEATKLGAFDFMEKPLHRDRVLLSIRNALSQNILRRECVDLRKKADKKYELIGNHPLMKNLWNEILKAARSNANVLIYGESGTGKELIARAIHAKSLRAKERFVQVNCAAIPEELIESELFGHEKGSFTGATEKKEGKFEQADGGTIFLDEVGDMSLKTQSKVLRVLEEGEVQKVGSNRINRVDVRVIAATNKDLPKEIREGKFREDLYFRLNVVPLSSPPLREKKEDIPASRGVLLPDLCGRKQCQDQKILRRGAPGHHEIPLERERARTQKRRRAIDYHDRGRYYREAGPPGRDQGRDQGRASRGPGVQDPQRFSGPGREGVHPGQTRGEQLEHLPDGQGDRYAAEQSLQEARAIRNQDNDWSGRGGCSFLG